MNSSKRPISVTILGWVYIAVGTVGFAYHLTEFRANGALQYDKVWIELAELLAIVCGVFVLPGHSWARWLALGWMSFHVILVRFTRSRSSRFTVCSAS